MPEKIIDPDAPEPVVVRYYGYIERPVGRPVLVFSNGFLVLDDPDPLKVGWYENRGEYMMQALVNDAALDAIVLSNSEEQLRPNVGEFITLRFISEGTRAVLGVAPPPGADQMNHVMVQSETAPTVGTFSAYAFPNSRYIRANDPNCDPQWRTQNAMQVAGQFDDDGYPTQHAHAPIREGVLVFHRGQGLEYVGYVRPEDGAPTLFFKTGFLVQASGEAAAIGWYPYRHEYQALGNVGAGFDQITMTALRSIKTSMRPIYTEVKDMMLQEMETRLSRHSPDVAERQCLVVDSPDPTEADSASLFSFGGPLLRPGDKNFDANFDAAYAAHALGPLDAHGVPTTRRTIAAPVGISVIE